MHVYNQGKQIYKQLIISSFYKEYYCKVGLKRDCLSVHTSHVFSQE